MTLATTALHHWPTGPCQAHVALETGLKKPVLKRLKLTGRARGRSIIRTALRFGKFFPLNLLR